MLLKRSARVCLRAVTNKLLFSEVVVLGPCSVPGCSTHHLQAAKPRKRRSGSEFLAALKSVENISWARYCCVFHERGGFKLEEPVARCLGFYWCKQEWLSFPVCKIIQASWAMGFWMLFLTGSVVLLQWDRRKYLTVPIKGKKKRETSGSGAEALENLPQMPVLLVWLQKKSCAFPKTDHIPDNALQGAWQCLQHRWDVCQSRKQGALHRRSLFLLVLLGSSVVVLIFSIYHEFLSALVHLCASSLLCCCFEKHLQNQRDFFGFVQICELCVLWDFHASWTIIIIIIFWLQVRKMFLEMRVHFFTDLLVS